MDIIIKILEYMVEVDRGLTNYDTDYLKQLIEEAKEELEL